MPVLDPSSKGSWLITIIKAGLHWPLGHQYLIRPALLYLAGQVALASRTPSVLSSTAQLALASQDTSTLSAQPSSTWRDS
mmetsp:Transcript_11238/g.30664  ORF Transcript_11238/g.30664 Transcript_11238/m.30664 type:complete len:80 (-) Transcript_11238:1983-2222(-)